MESNGDIDVPIIPEMFSEKDSAAKSFSQVIFPDISDYFPPGKDVRVSYTVTEALEPSSRDWIGLFKVGWSSAREYITFVWAPKWGSEHVQDRTVSVVFTAYYLPADKIEFYQFCYVTKQAHIRGASTPFQFRNVMEFDQLVEVEDETGMIVLKTKTAALEEQLTKVSAEKIKLQSEYVQLNSENDKVLKEKDQIDGELKETKEKLDIMNGNYGKEVEENELKAKLLEEVTNEKKTACLKISKQKSELENAAFAIAKLTGETLGRKEKFEKAEEVHHDEISSLNEQLDVKVDELTKSECKINDLTEKVKKLECETSDLLQKSIQTDEVQMNITILTKERDASQVKITSLEGERKLFKDQFTHSEEARRDIMQKIACLKDETKMKEVVIVNREEKLMAYETKIQILKDELKATKGEALIQVSTMETQLNNVEDKLNACQASKRLIAIELTEARDTRDKLMSDLHQAKMEQIVVGHLQSAPENVSSDKNPLSENSTQTSLVTVEQNLSHAENEEKLTSGGQAMKDLKTQVEDLRTRLSMGAVAYKEKYMECHSLEKKLKKVTAQKTNKASTVVKRPLSDSTTSDSFDDQKNPKIRQTKLTCQKKHSDMDQGTSANFMGKLEQMFMTIADPDAQEHEQLRTKMSKLERNLQSQHLKCRKYKQLYKDAKEKQFSDYEKSVEESVSLTQELMNLKAAHGVQQNENKALHEQLKEYMDVMKQPSAGEPTTPNAPIITRYRNPYKKDQTSKQLLSKGVYPHDEMFQGQRIISRNSSDSDQDDDFQMMHDRFGSVALCPKNMSSEESDQVGILHITKQDTSSPASVIKQQPTRSPPMIEVISSGKNASSSVSRRTSSHSSSSTKPKKSRKHRA